MNNDKLKFKTKDELRERLFQLRDMGDGLYRKIIISNWKKLYKPFTVDGVEWNGYIMENNEGKLLETFTNNSDTNNSDTNNSEDDKK